MWLRLAIALDRVRPRHVIQRIRLNWPYYTLTFFVVLPLWYMAASLAWRSHLYSFRGGSPSPDQLKVFLTFIGGGLATAVTMYGALLTRAHNMREHRSLQLKAVLDSLGTLPPSSSPERMSAVFSAMVLLGQQRVALRALDPAVRKGTLEMATATWVIDQVLTSADSRKPLDGGRVDDQAAVEAAILLSNYAQQGRLTADEDGGYCFADHFMRNWNRTLPHDARLWILRAISHMLLSRDKNWWSVSGRIPDFPTYTLLRCAAGDLEPVVRATAAVPLGVILDCFRAPAEGPKRDLYDEADRVRRKRRTTAAASRVSEVDRDLAARIAKRWSDGSAGAG
ncbi:hypothetical protein [Actinomadura gamaensis]|uniref:Uncharacterized protein n=1 Tax=Actinomadura gamaensis TaxID=1763541 RepID=A0ABV9U9V3_9ACTN